MSNLVFATHMPGTTAILPGVRLAKQEAANKYRHIGVHVARHQSRSSVVAPFPSVREKQDRLNTPSWAFSIGRRAMFATSTSQSITPGRASSTWACALSITHFVCFGDGRLMAREDLHSIDKSRFMIKQSQHKEGLPPIRYVNKPVM